MPSRSHIATYQSLDYEIDCLVTQINERWSEKDWKPIVYLKQHFGQRDMAALHRLANFCIVSSLHDGLNLVAKEYVSSRHDGDGALILSHFTGTARELTDALLINPFAAEETANAIRRALEMPEAERRKRMKRMRDAVAGNNVYRWAGSMLLDAARLRKRDEIDRVIGEPPPTLPANVVPFAERRRMAAP